ncbi:hypothetical protein [Streptomyces sp. NPDC047079]|uniref:hypothetical protein n=1 Tax=Streptomyces sp. NPDC047079 TaxID=3154607 RepID=UPI0033D41DFF
MHYEIRKVRTAQGPVKPSRERAADSRLMRQGYSNAEACRIVGVSDRMGRKPARRLPVVRPEVSG